MSRTSCLRLLRNGARIEQVGQIRRVGCITEIRPHVKDILQCAQIGRMRVIHRAGEVTAADVLVSTRGDDDFPNGVVEVVRIVARDAV